jgi:glycosyltransferase involved in cell wall biosynthesis
LYQAFGMPGIEAMACGTPTVLPNIGGIHEYAVDEINTLLVTPGDERAAVAAILRLLDDRELREKLVRNGFDQPPRFCHRDEAQLHIELYRRLLSDEPISRRLLTAAG